MTDHSTTELTQLTEQLSLFDSDHGPPLTVPLTPPESGPDLAGRKSRLTERVPELCCRSEGDRDDPSVVNIILHQYFFILLNKFCFSRLLHSVIIVTQENVISFLVINTIITFVCFYIAQDLLYLLY